MITRLSLLRQFASSAPAAAQNIDNIEQYWEKGLDWYNIMNAELSLKAYKTLVPFLDLKHAKKILEIGGGTGAGASLIIPHMSPSATYTLTDHIESFLNVARKRNLPQTEVIKCSPDNLPFNGESFDRFIALATLEELHTTKKIIQEAYRVLIPGGMMAASLSGKRESDSYRLIMDKVKNRFNISSPFQFRNDLKHLGVIMRMFEKTGFQRLFKFYESAQFGSDDIEYLKKFYLQEPSIAEQPADKLKDIEEYLGKLLTDLIKREGIPVETEYLIILAFKG